jgi:hypothetical protein
LKQPPIQFPLCPKSPIQNLNNNVGPSHVGDEGNGIEVGMDDFLRDTRAMEGMLLDAFQQNELGDDVDVVDTFSENLKYASTTPLFGLVHESTGSTQLWTTMLMYNLKAMYGMLDVCFTTLLR